jgi:lia operon protein LiaG
LVSCQSPEQTITLDYEEAFSDIKEIELKGRFLEVDYEGMERREEVILNAYLEVPESSGIDIKYRKSGSKLIIEVVGDDMEMWNFGASRQGYIHLTGPENIKLNFSNSSGSLDISNVTHDDIDLKVSSGTIKVSDLTVSNILLAASSGRISGDAIYGDVRIKINSGAINLTNIEGDVNSEGSSGSLKLENVRGLVNAKIRSGVIKLNNIQELGVLEVSSGSIKVDKSGLGNNTDLKASSGSIHIQTISDIQQYNFDLNASSGNVRVGTENSGKKLEINNNSQVTVTGRVSSGSIKIEN